MGRDPDKDEGLDSDTRDEKDVEMQSDLEGSNSKDVNDGEMKSVSGCQDDEDVEMLNSPENEDEVTRSPLSMKGATLQGTPMKNIIQSVPGACTSSTTKTLKSDSATTAKFEGFDIRSDAVPILQMIWRKHGNIIENSIIRNGDIVARALETLATMVRILEDNSAQSLSGCQSDYLSSTLSDLRCFCFKVDWLIPFVEKAIELHKSKPLLESLNNLSQLSSKVKERRTILNAELSKLGEEENKLKEEMAKVSKMIPLYGKVKFDEPLGLGIR